MVKISKFLSSSPWPHRSKNTEIEELRHPEGHPGPIEVPTQNFKNRQKFKVSWNFSQNLTKFWPKCLTNFVNFGPRPPDPRGTCQDPSAQYRFSGEIPWGLDLGRQGPRPQKWPNGQNGLKSDPTLKFGPWDKNPSWPNWPDQILTSENFDLLLKFWKKLKIWP